MCEEVFTQSVVLSDEEETDERRKGTVDRTTSTGPPGKRTRSKPHHPLIPNDLSQKIPSQIPISFIKLVLIVPSSQNRLTFLASFLLIVPLYLFSTKLYFSPCSTKRTTGHALGLIAAVPAHMYLEQRPSMSSCIVSLRLCNT